MSHVEPIQAEATAAVMAKATMREADFHALMVAALPKLRIQALAMTRNRADADDLVQAAVSNALAARHSFAADTNFGAWMFRILRNRFLSDMRRRRETCDIEDAPQTALSRPAGQEDSLALGELRVHMARLPADQRTALVMVSVQGLSYEEVAEAMACPVGTAKCRVFRARKQLQVWLLGETRETPRGAEGAGRGREAQCAGAAASGSARLATGRHGGEGSRPGV